MRVDLQPNYATNGREHKQKHNSFILQIRIAPLALSPLHGPRLLLLLKLDISLKQ
jgi:hypothetical protein